MNQVAWVTRDGTAEVIDSTMRGSFLSVALSPDGTRLALGTWESGETHVWIKQLDQGPLQKLTVEGPWNWNPSWTADGRSVMFAQRRAEQRWTTLYLRRADGSGIAEVVLHREQEIQSGAWSRDGQWLVYQADDNLYALRPGVDSVPRTLVESPFKVSWPALSPNGTQWFAAVPGTLHVSAAASRSRWPCPTRLSV